MKFFILIQSIFCICSCSARNLQFNAPGLVSDVPTGGEERIQIGDPVGPSTFAGALIIYGIGGKYFNSFCTASLISPNRILTAAHCFEPWMSNPIVQLKAVFGLSDLREPSIQANENNPNVSIIPFNFPRDVRNHENYTGAADVFLNDISIIELSQPVTAANVKPVKLAKKEYTENIYDVGWGRKDCVNASTETLRRAAGIIQSQERCNQAMKPYRGGIPFYDSQICAYFTSKASGSAGVASGDSGGPLFKDGPGDIIQVGVTSHVVFTNYRFEEGWRCVNSYVPQVFTRVSSFEDWILKLVPEAQFV